MGDSSDPEARLKRQRDDLRLLNQVMRHDIRNDLQLVEAYAELLDDHVDEEGESYLEVIKENTESAVGLTTTVRDLSRVMLREDAEPEGVTLDRVLSQQVEEVRSSYTEAVFTIDGTIPSVEVLADEMLGSVFRNVLRNAVQHNDETPPVVDVAARVDDSRQGRCRSNCRQRPGRPAGSARGDLRERREGTRQPRRRHRALLSPVTRRGVRR